MEIGVEVVSERNVALKFDTFPVQAHAGLLQVITQATVQLRGMVADRVPKRTGLLASEISSRVLDYPDRITGIVEIAGMVPGDFGKAAALEYGAHGQAHVREHAEKLGHLFGKMMQPIQVIVRAHDRRLNIEQHDFLRGPLAEISGDVMAQMQEVLAQVIEE